MLCTLEEQLTLILKLSKTWESGQEYKNMYSYVRNKGCHSFEGVVGGIHESPGRS